MEEGALRFFWSVVPHHGRTGGGYSAIGLLVSLTATILNIRAQFSDNSSYKAEDRTYIGEQHSEECHAYQDGADDNSRH